MGFVLMTNPKLDGVTYPAPEEAVAHYESLGWKLAAGRDKDKNLKDVRDTAAAFEDDVIAVNQASPAAITAEGASK